MMCGRELESLCRSGGRSRSPGEGAAELRCEKPSSKNLPGWKMQRRLSSRRDVCFLGEGVRG